MVKKIIGKVLKFAGVEFRYGVFKKIKKESSPNYKNEFDLEKGNQLIAEKIKCSSPFVVSRLGASELMIVLNYLHYHKKKRILWTDYLRDEIKRQSGVFPTDDESLNEFAKIYLESIKSIDILGVWYNEGEDFVIERYCSNASLLPLKSLEPYFFSNPWSCHLKGKKVLVIHPFEESIKNQYKIRKSLFLNKDVLPEFTLITIKAVQSQVYNETEFNSWFQVLENMKTQILKTDFDIAIIGAGAYGLPLASFVKQLGKQAIHMGGATQLLFGIKGKRWEDRDEFQHLFNNSWKNPDDSEKPLHYKALEKGAYW